jgi:hypothetical protein
VAEILALACFLIAAILIALGKDLGSKSPVGALGISLLFATLGGYLLWHIARGASIGRVLVLARGGGLVDPQAQYGDAVIGGIFTLGVAASLLAVAVAALVRAWRKTQSRER